MPLPIDSLLPHIVASLRARDALVLEAPPGAGKTTRVPPALLDAGLAGAREIVVLQPRRLATRLAAARVAAERGERLGETIGYQIRFDEVSSAKTRIRFVTEGLLTRRLIADPLLRDVGIVILDEFHERHLAGDLALSMIRRLQKTSRPDLKLVVMSATLDAAPIAAWLDQAPALRSEGRPFEVTTEYVEKDDDRPIEQQVLAGLKRLIQAQLDGHVLVFLPGAAEIRRSEEACAEFASRHQLELLILHGDLSAADQDRALRATPNRKVILSTNVAETSVTIEGIAAVIDSGLARVAAQSPWSGLPTLKTQRVSKSSAIQRMGRAGRTRAGTCLRLYTRADYEGRPQSDPPEIRRLDFAEAALSLRALGISDVRSFPFFEPPPAAALDAAEQLLELLGAIDRSGQLTAVGKRLLSLPLHPRLARVVVAGEQHGVADDALSIAALLSERDIRTEARAHFSHSSRRSDALAGPSDVLELLERYKEGQATSARSAGLDAAALQSVERVRRQISRALDRSQSVSLSEQAREESLLKAILTGYTDRVAKRRKPRTPELVFAAGGAASLSRASVVHDAELMVAVDAEERRGVVEVRNASQIQPEWLLEFADQLAESDGLEWNAEAARVDRVTRMTFGKISLDETRAPAQPSVETSKVLARAAVDAGIHVLVEPRTLSDWQCRVEALRAAFPKAEFPVPDDAFIRERLIALCEGLRSFSEIREAGLIHALNASLTPEQVRLLRTEAPDRITLPSGRSVEVHYEPARPPWVESRLQDFFGMLKGPSLGQRPLVLHLLAPNMRAVQVTTDLAGFWDRHYPSIRKELMRQYPKHAWPEDPRTASPPTPRARR